ncbi:MAG: EAL domain-containing protein [Symploca sp. SIO2B6]|nr:EAL domain-containing protein [Symploca sp. SIO2B6]
MGDRLQHEEVRVVKSGEDEVLFVIRDITDRTQAEEQLKESEQRFRRAIEVAPFPMMIHADDGEVLQINSVWTELTGYRHEDIPSTQAWTQKAYGHHADAIFEQAAETYILPSRMNEGDFCVITRDGTQRIWQFSSASLGQLPDGRQAVISMAVDMTQQRQADLALRESEQRFRNMAANVPGAIFKYVLHPDGADKLTYMSPGCYDLWEVQAESMVEDASILWSMVHPDDLPGKKASVRESARTLQPWLWQWRITTPSGKLKWLKAAGRPERHENGDVVWDTLIMDISDRIHAQQQLKHDALHDRLTGLPNRSLLMERLDLALKRTQHNPGHSFAVLFLDLDNFKVVNDSLGHLVGDELLLVVARYLTTFISETDIAARLGGDEFVILLENMDDIEGVIGVAERILDTLRSPLKLGDRDVFTSTSIGIVVRTAQHQKADDLLRDADLAMYRAKQNGRGQYALFDPTMHFHAVERLNLENDLRKALDNQEFELYYQPIVHLETLTICGFEALIRWHHPEKGFVPPNAFIKVAEETGLIIPIGQWILQTACQQLAHWHVQFPKQPLQISVNLSAKQLRHQLLQELDNILFATPIPANSLVLEITESMLVQNVQSASLLLEHIQARDIHLSIDDFGTGYSSLSYLHQLPVQALKIDRAFVSPSAANTRNQVIAESIIALSNLLKLRAIAEGLETLEQLRWLQNLGCEFGQGFLFSPPVPVNRATALLRENKVIEKVILEKRMMT